MARGIIRSSVIGPLAKRFAQKVVFQVVSVAIVVPKAAVAGAVDTTIA